MAIDLGEWVLSHLKADTTVTSLVMDAAVGFIESGELMSKDVEEAERIRLESDATLGTLTLRVLVQDTGEYQFEGDIFARCSVFVLDRRKGYRNIRAVREAILSSVVARSVNLTRDAYIVKLRHMGRSGHATMQNFDLEYERIDLQGQILALEPDIYT